MTAVPNSCPLRDAVDEAERLYVTRNPVSAQEMEKAARHLPGGNTRSSLFHRPFPLRMASGRDCRLTDVDGHDYVDLLGEFTAGLAGHSCQAQIDAIVAALRNGLNLSAHNVLESRLAEELCRRFPSMAMVRFTNSGTEANLMAIAAAKAFTGRDRVVVFENAYHGGLLSFSPGGIEVAAPHDYLILPYNDIEAARAAFAEHAGSIAVVLVEPMLGAGGCTPAEPDFLAVLRRLTEDAGAILAFDEVQTSRLSVGGRQRILGIAPDLTTIGKYFGGGLAFGAFGGRGDLMALFDPRHPGALMHAGTFNNNTLTMAAGLAVLDAVITAETLERINALGDGLRDGLNALFARHAAPFEATGLGSIMNIHPVPRRTPEAELLRKLLFLDLLESGYFIAARGLIALSLPVGQAEVDGFLAAVGLFLTRRQRIFPAAD